MTVHVPSPLHSYTRRQSVVHAAGTTVAEVLADLDRQFPGIRFRMIDEQDGIRDHIRIFVNSTLAADTRVRLRPADEIDIICAISGGSSVVGGL